MAVQSLVHIIVLAHPKRCIVSINRNVLSAVAWVQVIEEVGIAPGCLDSRVRFSVVIARHEQPTERVRIPERAEAAFARLHHYPGLENNMRVRDIEKDAVPSASRYLSRYKQDSDSN